MFFNGNKASNLSNLALNPGVESPFWASNCPPAKVDAMEAAAIEVAAIERWPPFVATMDVATMDVAAMAMLVAAIV